MQYPLINGFRYDFSSIEGRVDGKVQRGFTAINYTQSLEPGEARGNHAQLMGRTRGELSSEADVEMLAEEANEMIRTMGNGFMEKSFTLTAAYAEEGKAVVTDTLHGCRIKSVEKSNSQGSDALTVKLTLSVMFIEYNGVKPLKKMLS